MASLAEHGYRIISNTVVHCDGVNNVPGFYWLNEDGKQQGPYATEAEARRANFAYCNWLLGEDEPWPGC